MSVGQKLLIGGLKAAGEPTRLRILALLRHGDLAVGELARILDQSQPRLSHHLKSLTQAAWLNGSLRALGYFTEFSVEGGLTGCCRGSFRS